MDQRQLQIVLKLQDEASKELRKFAGDLDTTKKKTAESSEALSFMASKAKYLGLAVAAAGLATIGLGVKVAAQLETAKVGMATLLGSTEEANRTIDRIKVEAARTPFELPGLTQAVQLLSSVTMDGQKSVDVIMDIGEALAAMGKGQAELDRIIVNLQQVGAIGYASMIDIKQFAYAGIPIFKMLQTETGLAGEALADFISNGGVTFDLLTQMFDRANDKGGQFFNAYKNSAGTFDQMTSNMKDSLGMFAAEMVTTSGIQDVMKQGMGALTKEFGALTAANRQAGAESKVTAETGKMFFQVMSFMAEAIANVNYGLKILAASLVIIPSYIANAMNAIGLYNDESNEFWNGMREGAQDAVVSSENFALALHEQNQKVLADWNQLIEASTEGGDTAEKAYAKIATAATQASKEVIEANKSIVETKKKILELQEGFSANIQKQSQSYGDAVVAQEEKIRDLKQQIRDTDDEDIKETLQEQLDKEREALNSRRILYKAFDDEIAEAKRRAKLTDFERELEDIVKRGGELKKEFDKKMLLLQEELAANEDKRAQLKGINEGITADISAEVDKQVKKVHDGVNAQILEWKRLSAAEPTIASAFKYTNLISKRASGGPVTSGEPYVVGENGPEFFVPSSSGTIIPNNQIGGGSGGVSVNIYGDVSGTELIEKVKRAITMEIKLRQRLA